jgi:putative transposase
MEDGCRVAERRLNAPREPNTNPTATPMANTYTALHYHVVFSTRHRTPWIRPEFEERIWAYLGGIARENQMNARKIGGVEDHVHLLIGIPPVLALSKAVQLIKGGSSAWIKATFPELLDFGWQDGYGAFTVSKSLLEEVEHYIATQREHHRLKTFPEEYRTFLTRHGIVFEERYLFDGEAHG